MSEVQQVNERQRTGTSMSEIRLRLEDLWKHVPVFPVGANWAKPHLLSEYNWKFSNLEAAFREGGVLHGVEKVFLFSHADIPLRLLVNGQMKSTYIPTVVLIVSSIAPSDKFRITLNGSEEVIDMEKMNMAWVRCTPLGKRGSVLDIPLPEIYIISYVRREAASEYIGFDPGSQCIPYFDNPFKIDETKQSTIVDIKYTTEAGLIDSKFDWNFHGLEGFSNRFIDAGELPSDLKDAFKAFVKLKVEEGKRANREAIQKQIQDVEELRRTNVEATAAYEKMRFYKFYPVATPGTPDLSEAKFSLINKYYGMAHQVV